MPETILKKKKKIQKSIQFNFDEMTQTHSLYVTCKELHYN